MVKVQTILDENPYIKRAAFYDKSFFARNLRPLDGSQEVTYEELEKEHAYLNKIEVAKQITFIALAVLPALSVGTPMIVGAACISGISSAITEDCVKEENSILVQRDKLAQALFLVDGKAKRLYAQKEIAYNLAISCVAFAALQFFSVVFVNATVFFIASYAGYLLTKDFQIVGMVTLKYVFPRFDPDSSPSPA